MCKMQYINKRKTYKHVENIKFLLKKLLILKLLSTVLCYPYVILLHSNSVISLFSLIQ